jgi:DNA-binding GntR family transcriptional regulator
MQTIIPSRMRDQVRDALRSSILDGSVSAEGRLEEVELSRRLGVSRTPLREALIALEGEGLVHSSPNKGFAVVEADAALVRETYPILASLERLALLLSGDRLRNALPDLERINADLARETVSERQYALDAAFHERLTSECGNPRLLKLLATYWASARRFDGAQRRGTANQDGSCRQHRAIIAAIEEQDVQRAAQLLEVHWYEGIEVVVSWLERESRP